MKEKNRTSRPIPGKGIGQIDERLRKLVASSSIRALAKASGVSGGTLHNYLNGEGLRTLDNLSAIADAADVNLEWLVTGKGPMHPSDDVSATPALPADFDRAIFASVLTEVEKGMEQNRLSLAPEKKVELVLALYDIFKDSDKEPSTATILPFLRVGAR